MNTQKTPEQTEREHVLTAKHQAHVDSKSNPELTAEEKTELADLKKL